MVLAIRISEFRMSIINEKKKRRNLCRCDNQVAKVSLILSNSNPVRSFKVKDRDHKQLNCT